MTLNINDILDIKNNPDHSILKFFGFIDADTVENIKPVIEKKLPQNCKQIIIDLENVEFLDSHGIGFFVSVLKKVHKNNGRLFLSGASGQPESVLNMVGFNNSIVTYCKNLKEASALIKTAPDNTQSKGCDTPRM